MKEKMEERVLRFLRRPGYRPANKSELARALEVPSDERAALRQALRRLEGDGTILRAKKGRFVLQEADKRTVTGIYQRRKYGGEVRLGEERVGSDAAKVALKTRWIAIPEGLQHTALPGDRVLVKRRRPTADRGEPRWLRHLPKDKQQQLRERFARRGESGGGGSRQEGEVTKVLERAPRRIIGTLIGGGHPSPWAAFRPDDTKDYPERIDLPDGMPDGAEPGYKALVTIVSWESPRRRPQGRLVRVLGPADAPGIDVLAVIHKHGLPTEFPDEVLEDARRVGPGMEADTPLINADVLAEREDWRDQMILTIDPFDARDFDDAIGIKTLPGGGWELAVHIADVSHYVRPGSALDREARSRGNSVYLVDRVLPMLPEVLSNGICSLKPDEDRLTFAAVMVFDAKGRRLSARFVRGVIRSQARLTYEEAFERMQERESDDPITALLVEVWQLASTLRKRRFREGSLDLDFPESKVILDDRGRPKDIRLVENDASHQLIEECMLAANEAVAEKIMRAAKPSLYRVHDDPDPDKLLDFRDEALEHGYMVGDLTHRKELQKLLKDLRGQPDEPLLKLALLKSMKRAVYHEDSLGHYGLAKDNYTHFTSPIRRYTDLVVHRVLQNLIAKPGDTLETTPSYSAMSELAEHLSSTERVAAEAELESKRLKITQYFDDLRQRNPPVQLEALVTNCVRMGLMVELLDYGTRAMIRVHDLPEAESRRYRFDPRNRRFSGGKGYEYAVGDQLSVRVVRVERQRGFIDVAPL